jgi:hypothetical protein
VDHWRTAVHTMRAALADAGSSTSDIAAIGILPECRHIVGVVGGRKARKARSHLIIGCPGQEIRTSGQHSRSSVRDYWSTASRRSCA